VAIGKKISFKNNEPKFPAPLEGYAATVELPEGHHVTIGELTPGTIVEVATWNGTGKPDESTKRFLISADGTGLSRRSSESVEQIEQKQPSQIASASYQSTPFVNTQPIADPIFDRHSNYQVNNNAYASKVEDERSTSSTLFKIAAALLVPAMLFGAIAGVLKFGGIGVAVPTIGANSFFGPSTSSLVFYKKSNTVKTGTAVIAVENDVVVLGSYGGDIGSLAMFTINDKQMSVAKESLAGSSLILIPYIGTLLKPIIS